MTRFPMLLSFSFLLSAAALAENPQVDLTISANAPRFVDQGLPYVMQIEFANHSPATATGVVVTVDLPSATSVAVVAHECMPGVNRSVCTFATLPSSDSGAAPVVLNVLVTAPDHSDLGVGGSVTISSNESDLHPDSNRATFPTYTYHAIFVTNTADSGSGSLRTAIESANSYCGIQITWCKIAFRIPEGGDVKVIEPESPLPPLFVSYTSIDAATQTRYFGNTNPRGPEVELRGTRVPSSYLGNGLTIASTCDTTVRGLAITGFPSNGILVRGFVCANTPHVIEQNYIGVDATGARAIPNVRGIFFDDAGGRYEVRDNVISGNEASGIYIGRTSGTKIDRNIIGLSPDLRAGMGNGASGIFIAPAGFETDIRDNFIGFNGHYGVSLDRAERVDMSANSFQANGGLAIDYGRDGVTPEVEVNTRGGRVALRFPEITSARYDAVADQTIIEGTAPPSNATRAVHVNVYTNDVPDDSGFGEGQYFLGIVASDADGHWVFTRSGRIPAPWVAATASVETQAGTDGRLSGTTEFSRTVRLSE